MDNWDSFKLHLACDLLVQCTDGRDEEGCWQTKCHQEGFQVRGRCYYLDDGHRTYYEASKLCLTRGAKLVSFNTPEEMYVVAEAVCRQRPRTSFRVGLHNSPIGTSHLCVVHSRFLKFGAVFIVLHQIILGDRNHV